MPNEAMSRIVRILGILQFSLHDSVRIGGHSFLEKADEFLQRTDSALHPLSTLLFLLPGLLLLLKVECLHLKFRAIFDCGLVKLGLLLRRIPLFWALVATRMTTRTIQYPRSGSPHPSCPEQKRTTSSLIQRPSAFLEDLP
jgi:hypothetical protein